MTTAILEPASSIEIIPLDSHPDAANDETHDLYARDMRLIGLGRSGRLLGMQVADLGPLQVRRAKADLVHCPICPGH
jgi:hypothetical protein